MSKIIGVTVGTPINPKKVSGKTYTFDGKEITLTVGKHINVGDTIEFIYLKGEGYSIDITYNDHSFKTQNVNAELSNAVIRETFIVPENTSKCTFEGAYDVGQYVFLEKLVGVEKEVDELSEQKADKAYVVAIFEELKTLIQNGQTDSAIAVLDKAILDLSVLA